MDRICIDLYFFKWRYITAGLAILAFISSIIAAINPPNLTLPHTTHGETFSLGLAQGVWLTASIAVCVVSIGIFAHLAWQDIRYKWPYVISQAFAVCTACFRRERSGDLENQVGGVNPIELQDMPAPAAPAAPSPPRPSTRNVAPFTPEDATVPSTPLPSTSRTAPVTPESQRLADFVFPFSPDQPKDEDEGVEMGGESGESSRDMV